MLQDSLLSGIEEQKSIRPLSEKLFRYSGLIEAIDYFTQQLHFDQILDGAFDFINELISADQSALFCFDGNQYVRKKELGGFNFPVSLKNHAPLEEYAKLHGSVLRDPEAVSRYFGQEIIKRAEIKLVVPLIVDFGLYGFILISHKADMSFDENDAFICEVLMKLFNSALSNCKRYESLRKATLSLDEKIFNLFVINQSSKALLSELDLENLYSLSIDVFSELTQSAITGFVLYDDKSEAYMLKAYRDVSQAKPRPFLRLNSPAGVLLDSSKLLVDVSLPGDREYFNGLFEQGLVALKELKPTYIVMLVKNENLLGFVSLSDAVTGKPYTETSFELIESLASSTYISVSNAQLFSQVAEQKRNIQNKLDKLVSLNRLIKNINSSLRTEALLGLTLNTLKVAFDVKKAVLALYDKESRTFIPAGAIGVDEPIGQFAAHPMWDMLFEGKTLVINQEWEASRYLPDELTERLGRIGGAALVPLSLERSETELLGVIMVFLYGKSIVGSEENVLILESIAGHVAPSLYNLATLEEQKRFLLPNPIELFKKELKKEVRRAEEWSMELEVLEIMDSRDFVFKGEWIAERLKEEYEQVFPFSYNNVFVIHNQITQDAENRIRRWTGIESLRVKQLVYGRDFKSFAEFFTLFV